jgi:Zn-dependent protease with chaperone function
VHQRRRTAIRAAVVVLAVGGFVCNIAAAEQSGSGALIALGMGWIVASLLLGFGSRLRPARIDDHCVRLRGASAEFLDSLSEDGEALKRAA